MSEGCSPRVLGVVVLCGGESRRMGQPKLALRFGPETLVERVLRLVEPVAAARVVVAAPWQELPELAGDVIVARDLVPGQGPLHGLAAGLAAIPEGVELVYATGVDTPLLHPGWIAGLADLLGEDQDAVVPRVGGFVHPLAAVYRRAAAVAASQQAVASGLRRMLALLEPLRVRLVEEAELRAIDPELATLENLNTPEAYARAVVAAGLAGGDGAGPAGEGGG
jgi:molybdopterin-guanine dinucleotide biosynthesis protein A